MKIFSFLFKPLLNILASILKLSQHSVYYLVSGPLSKEIKEQSLKAFAYQHIENAISIAQTLNLTEGVILDVGGGTATTALLFSKKFPQNEIYIFEPLKENFAEIKKVAAQYHNWKLINEAVGSQIGQAEINVAKRSTASSLLEMNAHTDSYGDSLSLQKRETISITTIDSLESLKNKNIIILKIDVQGFELEVLRGAINSLYKTSIIVLEINNHSGYKGSPTYYEIDSFIRNNNFELYDILATNRFNNKLQDWDAIYVNKKHINQ